MIRTMLCAAALAAIPAFSAAAQSPFAGGTAAGLGGAPVTEARRADALAWNPALVGVYDGPLSSYSLLAVDVQALPSASWEGSARRLGLDAVPTRARWIQPASPSGGGNVTSAQVQWLGTQLREYALTLTTRHVAAADIPPWIAEALGDQGGRGPAPTDSATRSSFTTLAFGRGAFAGRMPALGGVWLGAAAKGTWVHSFARGAFSAQGPGEDVYEEAAIRDVPVYGLDVGAVVQPVQRVKLSAAVANAFSGAFRPSGGARVRRVTVVPTNGDTAAQVTQTETPHLGDADAGTAEARAAVSLWEATGFPAVLRTGASFETDLGSLAAAFRTRLTSGGLDPEWDAAPASVAFNGPPRFPVRVAYSWGSGISEASGGFAAGTCRRRWTAAVNRRAANWGTSLGFSFSTTVGSAAGCDLFHG